MRKILITIIVLTIVFLFIYPIAAATQTNKEHPSVVCTTTILANFTEQIVQDLVTVTTIAPPGMCPAHFDIKPSQLKAVNEAKVLISHNFEPWVENLLVSADRTVIERLILDGPWNNPPSALEKINQISETLIKQFPQFENEFTVNTKEYIQEINKQSKELKDRAEKLNIVNYEIIASTHQEPFAAWLGLNIVDTFSSPESVSTKKFLELILVGKKEGISLVVDNLQSGTDLGARIASDTNAKHAVLTNFPGLIPQTETLADMLTYNAEQIFKVLGEAEQNI